MAAKELTEILLKPAFPSPLPPIGDEQHAALKKLATAFQNISAKNIRKTNILKPNRILHTPKVPTLPPWPILTPLKKATQVPRVPIQTNPYPINQAPRVKSPGPKLLNNTLSNTDTSILRE